VSSGKKMRFINLVYPAALEAILEPFTR